MLQHVHFDVKGRIAAIRCGREATIPQRQKPTFRQPKNRVLLSSSCKPVGRSAWQRSLGVGWSDWPAAPAKDAISIQAANGIRTAVLQFHSRMLSHAGNLASVGYLLSGGEHKFLQKAHLDFTLKWAPFLTLGDWADTTKVAR